jgi:hypothetical protein
MGSYAMTYNLILGYYGFIVFFMVTLLGCTASNLVIKNHNKETILNMQDANFCAEIGYIVINDTVMIEDSQIFSIEQTDHYSQFSGYAFGYMVGFFSGALVSIPISSIACRNKSEEVHSIGSDKGWCKIGVSLPIMWFAGLGGGIYGMLYHGTDTINAESIPKCRDPDAPRFY